MDVRTSPQTLVNGERRLCKEGKEIPEMYYAFVLEKSKPVRWRPGKKKIMLSLYLSYAPGPILSKLGQNFDWLIHAYIFVLHRQLNLCVILLLYSSTAATELNTAAIRFFFSFTARLFILCLFIKSVRDSSMAAFLRAHSAKRKRCWPHLLAFRNRIASEYESLYFSLILLCLWRRA